jgi:Putative Ig domain
MTDLSQASGYAKRAAVLLFVGFAAVAASGCRTDSKTATASTAQSAISKVSTFSGTIKSRTVNHAPKISGTPPSSAKVGQAYAFVPKATDVDRDVLRFSIVNLPSWATFNPETGRISGIPPAGADGAYVNIVLSVSDGTNVEFLPMFQILVAAATEPTSASSSTNRPPRISGTPAGSVMIGQSYAFQPSASDPDGQKLTFSISNAPAWAAFSSSTGRLSGTPAAADAGTVSNIVISVTDGQATSSLAAFSIAVNQVANGVAEVTWIPPTENTDGSPLTDLKGYRIRYGLAPNALANVVTIPAVGISSAVIENLGPGTWYFGVVAYNASAVESALSDIVQKTVK